MIGFVVKSLFWIGVVLLFLPEDVFSINDDKALYSSYNKVDCEHFLVRQTEMPASIREYCNRLYVGQFTNEGGENAPHLSEDNIFVVLEWYFLSAKDGLEHHVLRPLLSALFSQHGQHDTLMRRDKMIPHSFEERYS